MTQIFAASDLTAKRTQTAFIWTSILNMPFWAIYPVLLFILYKDLHATPLQISVAVMMRPLVSLFSIYWSAYVNKRRDRLISNIMWAALLGPLPLFFFPFIDDPWYVIFASGFYITLAKGVIPAWMEILKLNIPEGTRKKVVSFSFAFSYVMSGLLSLVIGRLMDDYFQVWRWIFPITALLSMMGIFFQSRISIKLDEASVPPIPSGAAIFESNSTSITLSSLIKQIMDPWKNGYVLLRSRPDFVRYLSGVMLGGFGLVIIQPALPVFFIDVLNLSYTELTAAFTLCKGLAFAATSSFWARWLHQVNIYRFSGLVSMLACLFPLLLISAQMHLVLIYIAYLVYGMMQGGNELSWHLSGPIFSKGEDSSLYSTVNLALVGLRGCIAPILGSLLVVAFNPTVVLLISTLLSLVACRLMYAYSRAEESLLATPENA